MSQNNRDSGVISAHQPFDLWSISEFGPLNIPLACSWWKMVSVMDVSARHQSLTVSTFLAKTIILPHLPYSPDPDLYNFHLFCKQPSHLQGCHFSNAEDLKIAPLEVLKDVANQDFQKCFKEVTHILKVDVL